MWKYYFCLFIFALSLPAIAQDEKATEKEKAKTEAAAPKEAAKPEETKPAEEKTATPKETSAPAANGEALYKEYAALLEEWKTIIKDLRKLRTDYTEAKDDQKAALETQWKELITKGNDILPKIRRAAQAAYVDGKSNDPQLLRFLLKVSGTAVAEDDYEIAYAMGKAILDRFEADAAPPPKEIYNIVGISAYLVNEYDIAERCLKLAKDADSLKSPGDIYLEKIKKYKDLWTKEQEIRAKEAEANDLPRVKLTTTAGVMVLEMFENEAPETVANFINLVETKFYNGLIFHRVLDGFMAQGGCPQGTGTGGPGYRIYCETQVPHYRKHFRGTLSMAHAGPDTGGSQFFICFTPQESLDGKHTAFGRVIEGLDVLAKIQRIDPQNPPSTPVERTKIITAEVIRKRDHVYSPRKVE